jgi:hypothetical protein
MFQIEYISARRLKQERAEDLDWSPIPSLCFDDEQAAQAEADLLDAETDGDYKHRVRPMAVAA